MKKILKIADNIVEKEIQISDDNIPQRIHRLAIDFEMKWGFPLEAVLIGPSEYVCLIKVIKETSLYARQHVQIYEIDEFMGLKIRLKSSKGIEAEYPKKLWPHIAMGQIL